MFLLSFYFLILSFSKHFEYNITKETTITYLQNQNDEIFIQVPLTNLAFLVHSTSNLIMSVNVDLIKHLPDIPKPGFPDKSKQHLGFLGHNSRSFGVYFGNNTGSIYIRCQNETTLSFSTVVIPPECDIVHTSLASNDIFNIVSPDLLVEMNKNEINETLNPNKTICFWHSTPSKSQTFIEFNQIDNLSDISIDYISKTTNFQYNIMTKNCENEPNTTVKPTPPPKPTKHPKPFPTKTPRPTKIPPKPTRPSNPYTASTKTHLFTPTQESPPTSESKFPITKGVTPTEEPFNPTEEPSSSSEKIYFPTPRPTRTKYLLPTKPNPPWKPPFQGKDPDDPNDLPPVVDDKDHNDRNDFDFDPIFYWRSKLKSKQISSPMHEKSNLKRIECSDYFHRGWDEKEEMDKTDEFYTNKSGSSQEDEHPKQVLERNRKSLKRRSKRRAKSNRRKMLQLLSDDEIKSSIHDSHIGNSFTAIRIGSFIHSNASITFKFAKDQNQTTSFDSVPYHSIIIPQSMPSFLVDEKFFPVQPGPIFPNRPGFIPDQFDCVNSFNCRDDGSVGHQKYFKKQMITISYFLCTVCSICTIIIIACMVFIYLKNKDKNIQMKKIESFEKEQQDIETGIKKLPHIPQATNPPPLNSLFQTNLHQPELKEPLNLKAQIECDSMDDVSDVSV